MKYTIQATGPLFASFPPTLFSHTQAHLPCSFLSLWFTTLLVRRPLRWLIPKQLSLFVGLLLLKPHPLAHAQT